jgi:hypothetical protein
MIPSEQRILFLPHNKNTGIGITPSADMRYTKQNYGVRIEKVSDILKSVKGIICTVPKQLI